MSIDIKMEGDTNGNSVSDENIIRIRGIPWACSKDAIKTFFSNCAIKNDEDGIHFVTKEGKQTGEAYIEFETAEDVEQAKKKNRNYIGSRYIEVFDACRSEMEHFLNGGGPESSAKRRRNGGGPPFGEDIPFGGTVEYLDDIKSPPNVYIRLRGLPYTCAERDIYQFFEGIEIAPNGIKLPLDRKMQSVGEAFIQFATTLDADNAMRKHKEKIGHRYIEVFRSNPKEFHKVYIEGRMPPPPNGLIRHPPPRFRGGPPDPWMDGYGPRAYGSLLPRPPREYCPPREYPPAPPGSYGHPDWEMGPPPPAQRPSYNQYGSSAAPTNPYFEDYQPPWMREPSVEYEATGPIKPRPPSRPVPNRSAPYELPDRYHFYKREQQEAEYYKREQQQAEYEEEQERNLFPSTAQPLPPSAAPSRGSDHFVFVRGLPFHVREADVEQFFISAPSYVKPTFVKLILDEYNRPTEAKVEFASHQDALKAMEKDKATLLSRPMDLFLCSKEVSNAPNNYETRPSETKKEPVREPKQVFGSNYSYNLPPTNGSQKTSAAGASSQPPPPQSNDKNYSFYGMVPDGWRSEYSVGPAASQQPVAAASTAAAPYNYGYTNPYYGYGAAGQPYGYPPGYPGYSTTPAQPSANGLKHTIRKEPISYT